MYKIILLLLLLFGEIGDIERVREILEIFPFFRYCERYNGIHLYISAKSLQHKDIHDYIQL
jgi:hypothetical protein